MQSGRLDTDQADLLRLCRAGDSDAWSEMWRRYQKLAFHVALRCGLNPSLCPDVVQETFLALFRNLHNVVSPEALPSWIAVTASRIARRQMSRTRGETLLDEAADRGANLEDELIERNHQQELRSLLGRAFDQIPQESAELIKLLYIDELSYNEISERTGRPVGSIGPMRMRTLAKLRKVIEEPVAA